MKAERLRRGIPEGASAIEVQDSLRTIRQCGALNLFSHEQPHAVIRGRVAVTELRCRYHADPNRSEKKTRCVQVIPAQHRQLFPRIFQDPANTWPAPVKNREAPKVQKAHLILLAEALSSDTARLSHFTKGEIQALRGLSFFGTIAANVDAKGDLLAPRVRHLRLASLLYHLGEPLPAPFNAQTLVI